jgi:hypothetical protein
LSDLIFRLQKTLEYFYRVESPVLAQEHRISESQLRALFGRGFNIPRREALYVSQSAENDTDLGLFIEASQVHDAEKFVRAPQSGSLDAFCVALEGVSHFLYLSYCASALQRPVSQLELELQAEVDKFLVLRLLFGIKDAATRLFTNFRLHENVPKNEQERYRIAHRQAQRYAQSAESRFQQGKITSVVDDARQFYRKPMSCKLAHIAVNA